MLINWKKNRQQQNCEQFTLCNNTVIQDVSSVFSPFRPHHAELNLRSTVSQCRRRKSVYMSSSSLVRYTNRPFGNQRKYRKRLIIRPVQCTHVVCVTLASPQTVHACNNLQAGPKKWGHELIAIILSNLPDLQIVFTGRFFSKFAVNWLLKIPPFFAYVATLPCETLIMSENKRLSKNYKVAWLHI